MNAFTLRSTLRSVLRSNRALAPGRSSAPRIQGFKAVKAGALGALAVGLGACGDAEVGTPDLEVAVFESAPAGAAATFSSNTIPGTLAPGERVNVQVQVTNSGTVDWTNLDEWGMFRKNTLFGWSTDLIEASVTQGNVSTHNLIITTPVSSASVEADFYSLITGQTGIISGSALSVPVTIDGAQARQYSCSYSSDTIPDPIVAGEVASVSVVVTNNGQQTWPASDFCLYAREDQDSTDPSLTRWGSAICTATDSTVAASASHTFNLNITAPSTPGSYRFMRQLADNREITSGGIGLFDLDDFCVDETITVGSGTLSRDASVVSENFPSTMAPGDLFDVTVVMQNDGSTSWPAAGDIKFTSLNSPVSLWGVTVVEVPSTTANGASATFTFTVQAPNSTGMQNFAFQMFDTSLGTAFGTMINEAVNIDGAITPALGASVVSENFPASVAPNSSTAVSVTLQNDGTETWTTSDFSLVSTNSPTSLWSTTVVNLPADVTSGNQTTLNFNVVAPNTTGSETFNFSMFKNGTGTFGTAIAEAVNVDGAITPAYGASVVSQTIPGSMEVNSTQSFTIVMQNDGTETWTAGSSVQLYTDNSPAALFTTLAAAVPSDTTTGNQASFTFNVTAPSTPASYDSRWRMVQLGGIGYFGDTALTSAVTVTSPAGCGNGTVAGAETCDDGNTTAGDGCSASCLIENRSVDLGSQASGRTFLGYQTNKQLAAVTVEDLNGDGNADVIMSDFSNTDTLAQAGRVYVHAGGGGFFTGASAAVNSSPLLSISGAAAGDYFGGLTGGLEVGDVTVDGNADLVVGAQFADGPSDARASAGEVYVIPGSATLYAGGTFAVTDTTPYTVAGKVIEGKAAGDQLRVLAIGDVTNDGNADIILGAQFNDDGGTDAGQVYVISGASSLATAGTIDLASASIQATITGAAAGGQLGVAAAIGDVSGDGINDLAISAPTLTANSNSRAGVVYVLNGPVSGALPLSTASNYDTAIQGEAANVLYGTDLAIANVIDTSTADLIVGAAQARTSADGQVGEVHLWAGPLSTGTINNAVTGADGGVFGASKDYVGGAVAVGDTNGDSTADVIVGGGLADGTSDARSAAGEVSVFIGGTNLDSLQNFAASVLNYRSIGEAANDRLGGFRNALSSGDIDGDGRADWCAGAYLGGDSAATNAGRVDCFQSPW